MVRKSELSVGGFIFYYGQQKKNMEELLSSSKKNVRERFEKEKRTTRKKLKRAEKSLAGMAGGVGGLLERKEMERQIAAYTDTLARLEAGGGVREHERDARRFAKVTTMSNGACAHLQRGETSSMGAKRRRTQTRKLKVAGKGGELTSVNGASSSVCEDEFRERFLGEAPTLYVSVSTDVCQHCGGALVVGANGNRVCDACGTLATSLHFDENGGEDCLEYTSFSYRRVHHFSIWLNTFQARENVSVPQDVIDMIMQCLYYEFNIQDSRQITPGLVRKVLKHLNRKEVPMNKYYENTVLISCRISGKTPPRLEPDQERLLKTMFNAIQPVFERHKSKDRKNFLSYSYVLYKLMEIIGLPYLEYFPLLKSEKKKQNLDNIWRNICLDLNWQFIPSS